MKRTDSIRKLPTKRFDLNNKRIKLCIMFCTNFLSVSALLSLLNKMNLELYNKICYKSIKGFKGVEEELWEKTQKE